MNLKFGLNIFVVFLGIILSTVSVLYLAITRPEVALLCVAAAGVLALFATIDRKHAEPWLHQVIKSYTKSHAEVLNATLTSDFEEEELEDEDGEEE